MHVWWESRKKSPSYLNNHIKTCFNHWWRKNRTKTYHRNPLNILFSLSACSLLWKRSRNDLSNLSSICCISNPLNLKCSVLLLLSLELMSKQFFVLIVVGMKGMVKSLHFRHGVKLKSIVFATVLSPAVESPTNNTLTLAQFREISLLCSIVVLVCWRN